MSNEKVIVDLRTFQGALYYGRELTGDEVPLLDLVIDILESAPQPELTVWEGPMPESNGKSNFTAILMRKGGDIVDGITIDRSEYPDRVRYEADRVRYLLGELKDRPDILAYDADKHSGYVAAELALNVRHPKCHEAADAFWQYWNAYGETHRHGYYESTWGAINEALRMVGVREHEYMRPPHYKPGVRTVGPEKTPASGLNAQEFRSAVVGWRESDHPEWFCRRTAEHVADMGRKAEAEAATIKPAD